MDTDDMELFADVDDNVTNTDNNIETNDQNTNLNDDDGFLDYDDGIIDELDDEGIINEYDILDDDTNFDFEDEWIDEKDTSKTNKLVGQLTKNLNIMDKFLEVFMANPTNEIKKIKAEFDSLHTENKSVIESIPLLKILSDRVGDRVTRYEQFYDDIEFARNLEKEEKEQEEKQNEKLINRKRKQEQYKTNVDNYYKKQEKEKYQKDMEKFMNKHNMTPHGKKPLRKNIFDPDLDLPPVPHNSEGDDSGADSEDDIHPSLAELCDKRPFKNDNTFPSLIEKMKKKRENEKNMENEEMEHMEKLDEMERNREDMIFKEHEKYDDQTKGFVKWLNRL
jgi:hypothetical protein